MTKALVVDDSRIDRHMVRALLEKQGPFEVEEAEHGRAALAAMERSLPGIVFTDLQMPEMDGLELVDAIRERHPSVPVILMTAHGSEETAVEALRRGAASYVPKRKVAAELVATARQVLAIALEREQEHRILARMEECRQRFVLGNDPSVFPALISLCREELRRRRFADETGLVQIAMALDEALANALHHGNLEVDSRLRESGLDRYYEELERRRHLPPWRDRKVHFEVTLTPDEVRYTVRDEGPGFDPSSIPDCRKAENLEKASGRGLLLIRTFMDTVSFNKSGNEIVMTKRRATE